MLKCCPYEWHLVHVPQNQQLEKEKDIFSPNLFIFFLKACCSRRTRWNADIGGRIITSLRFADSIDAPA